MNEHASSTTPEPVPARDGLPRYKWTLAQFERLIEHGILGEDDRVELIEGEIIPMSPKGNRHEYVRDEVHDWLVRNLPREFRHSVELGWRPDGESYIEPDLLIYTRSGRPPQIPVRDVLLLIEVSKSSLGFDRDTKSKVYAGLGVREYWVVNAATLETLVHREPGPEGYGSVVTVPPTATLVPHLLPALGLSLGGLGIA